MKLILGILLLTAVGLKAANLEDWLQSGLLHPDLISSMRGELELTDDQQEKLKAQLDEARSQAEPLEAEVKEQQKAGEATATAHPDRHARCTDARAVAESPQPHPAEDGREG